MVATATTLASRIRAVGGHEEAADPAEAPHNDEPAEAGTSEDDAGPETA